MLTMGFGFQYMVRHHCNRHYNNVPHLHETDYWSFEGGDDARQKRMQEVGIDKLLHEEKHRNCCWGGIVGRRRRRSWLRASPHNSRAVIAMAENPSNQKGARHIDMLA